MQIAQLRRTELHQICKLAQTDMLGIDDVELNQPKCKTMVIIMCPIKELLTIRYDAQLFTAFTTNLEPKDIRQRYGDRIADRLNEMMTKIVYRNPTYRADSNGGWKGTEVSGMVYDFLQKSMKHNRDF